MIADVLFVDVVELTLGWKTRLKDYMKG